MAQKTCFDKDPEMLDLQGKQGFAVVSADLNDGFPALGVTQSEITTIASAPPAAQEYAQQWFGRLSRCFRSP